MEGNEYSLKRQEKIEKLTQSTYTLEELTLMTTCQLREICRNKKLINAIMNPMDKDELIKIIMYHMGKREQYIIEESLEDGKQRLQSLFQKIDIRTVEEKGLEIASKIVCYQGVELSYYDDVFIPYKKELEGTNAFIMSSDFQISGIFYLAAKGELKDKLYLLKKEDMECVDLYRNDYSLYCFEHKASELIYAIYHEQPNYIPQHLRAYRLPIIDFEIKQPMELRTPIAIDFGSTNTTVGVYLDDMFFEGREGEAFLRDKEKESIQYTSFYEKVKGNLVDRSMIPSVVGIISLEDKKPKYVFGFDAVRLGNVSYVDEGFCVFYDIKRWIVDYEKHEEITDREGRKAYIKRKDILQAYCTYIIRQTENRFKCKVKKIHVSCPVKQKYLFQKMFAHILPDYLEQEEEVLDEGAAVLYNTISGLIESKNIKEDFNYEVLLIDCGGGTTDLCISRFRIKDKRIAYEINIETAYENGDTDFGGNNLTYRIMQLLKIMLVNAYGLGMTIDTKNIMQGLDIDIYRFVDQHGSSMLYQQLDDEYQKTEKLIPTQFKQYEGFSKGIYYKVKNNFYYLFFLAEEIKKRFYEKVGTLSVIVSALPPEDNETEWISADKWKVSVIQDNEIKTLKEFPVLKFDLYTIQLLLKGDIYSIIHKFIEPMYRDGRVNKFSFIKLTGQSCKIDIFRSALKEFVPGCRIQFKRRNRENYNDIGLKMVCVDGALKYIRDRKSGYADVKIHSQEPVLPYTVSAFTHSGQEVELINGFIRENKVRTISRNLENVTLQLFLKDTEGKKRYSFHYDCRQETFLPQTCEEIENDYEGHIQQKDMDSIVNNEIKFFLWKRFEEWGYVIVPIYRKEEILFIGREKFYPFENEGWISNFFDGTR